MMMPKVFFVIFVLDMFASFDRKAVNGAYRKCGEKRGEGRHATKVAGLDLSW